jgi:Ca2+-binding RTX toxin-like protein
MPLIITPRKSIILSEKNDAVLKTYSQLFEIGGIDGAAGIDTFKLSGGLTSTSLTLNLNTPADQLVGITGFTLKNFERFNFSQFLGTLTVTGSDGDDLVIAGAGNDTITGGDGNDTLIGGAGNDSLDGGAGNDILIGGDGNDTLDGSIGSDTLTGGAGDDIYYVNAGTMITEAIDAGYDSVFSSVTWTLGENFENLILTGTSSINGTGNGGANYLQGNNGKNILDGGDGNDILDGDDGNDTLNGGLGADKLKGGDGNDIIYGGLGDDSLDGGLGADKLYGGDGADSLYGGLGNDSLYLGAGDAAVDTVNYYLSDGTDTIYDFVKGVGGDQLNLQGFGDVVVNLAEVGGNTLLTLGSTGELLVKLVGVTGFTDANIAATNITFVDNGSAT